VNGFGQPVISKQPSNQTASLFADATFRVTATGDAPLSYQWRFNDGDLIGKTNTSLTVLNVQRTDVGDYRVVVTNLSGTATSQVATLAITSFNSIYAFGFSWTDTQGAAHGCNGPTACPSCYWQGRYSNGPMWPEYVSTNLGLTYVTANNYAHCGAMASDILNQVINFPAPPKPKLSLYCLWAASPDVTTNQLTWTDKAIQTTLLIDSNSVNRLYAKGARSILIQLDFDGGKLPGNASDFGNNVALISKYGEYVARFNAAFLDLVDRYSQTKPDLRILFVDVLSKLNDVLANPAQYGFTKTTIGALDDPALTDKTLAGPGADYVFWNVLHPTTKLHKLMAAWHLEALTNSILEKLGMPIVGGSPNIQMNHLQIGRDYTLQTSTELQTWTDVQTFTASAGTNWWSGSIGNDSSGYFRLKWQR
jgi:phospholipase/lecithinase/hemolysin